MRNLPPLLLLPVLLAAPACSRYKDLRPDEQGLYHLSVPRMADASRKVELVFVRPKSEPAPWPVVIFLHGNEEVEDVGGKTFHDWGALQKAASLGFLAVAMSMPGYGESSGARDFAGADSQQAVHDVIKVLRRRSEVGYDGKVALVGVSRGATVAAKVAEQVAGLSGVVLVSGFYDLGDNFQHWQAAELPEGLALARELEHESVTSDAGLLDVTIRERSVLPSPLIQCPTLVLHGAKDPLTLPRQAETLVSKLKDRGVDARAVIYPQAGHRIPTEAREREIEPFLKRVLGR